MLKIMGKAQVSGRNYGQKIISILNGILSIKASNKTSKTEKESTTMNINTSLISNNNSYAGHKPAYIVIHNTDNYAKGAKHMLRLNMMETLKAILHMYMWTTQRRIRRFHTTVEHGT